MGDLTHVKGLDQLQKFLDQLPAKVEANIMRGALRAGAKAIERAAKINAPVGDPGGENARIYRGKVGALRDSIKVGTKRERGKVIAKVTAGGKSKGGPDVYYAHMVEYGTNPHTISGKNGRPLFFGGQYVKSVNHPGAGARPFMRPALDANQQTAVLAVGEYIKTRLQTKQGIDTSHITIEGDE